MKIVIVALLWFMCGACTAQSLSFGLLGTQTEVRPTAPTNHDVLEFITTFPQAMWDVGAPSIQRSGNRLLVLYFPNDHSTPGPRAPSIERIGPLPAGTYTIEVYGITLLRPDPTPQNLISTHTLVIAPAVEPPATIPSTGAFALALLASLLVGAGAWRRGKA